MINRRDKPLWFVSFLRTQRQATGRNPESNRRWLQIRGASHQAADAPLLRPLPPLHRRWLKTVHRRVAGAIAVESRRQIPGAQQLHIGGTHTQTAIERIDHAAGRRPQRKRCPVHPADTVGPEQMDLHIRISIEAAFHRLKFLPLKTHYGDVLWVNAVFLRMRTNKAHSPCQIQRPFLLGVGPQPVIHYKTLIAPLTEGFGHIDSSGWSLRN